MSPDGLFMQAAPYGLEVVLARAVRRPSAADLRAAWAKRRAGRVSPVLLVVVHPVHGEWKTSLCGPVGDQPAVHHGIDVSQAERLAAVALDEPNRHAATRFLLAALPELESDTPGLRNVGLLATQELQAGVPGMPEWPAAVRRAGPLLRLRGRPLVERLGFGVEVLSTNTSLLTVNGRNRAIAVFCDEDEPFDAPAQRFDGTSPVSRGLAVADQHNVDWVVLTRTAEIRLYAARPDTGVGRKGRAETFVELNLSLLPAERAGYLPLLFSTDALADGGTTDQILERSADFASNLAVRLRQRVYFETVPALAQAVAARLGHQPGESELDGAYEQVMTILFRLLFVAYAEDKDLLPYRTNSRYADHSLKRMARRLTEDRRGGRTDYDAQATDMWDDVRQLWRAVDAGNSGWGVPAYDGGLFSHDPGVSPAGAALAALRLTDAEFAPALAALLVDEGAEGHGPVDFRSLSVREFGTIYEGLLESRLAVATDDLTVRRIKGHDQYVPAGGDDPVEVVAGAVYLLNRSGVRKATGSYFTKPFAVEHLLDHALEPALGDHVARLDGLRAAGDDAALADSFFDFRCADIAMGSGHFLVAALDRIEARLSAWLALHPVPAVTAELNRLRDTALEALGDLGAGVEIETGSLLRRQVARHWRLRSGPQQGRRGTGPPVHLGAHVRARAAAVAAGPQPRLRRQPHRRRNTRRGRRGAGPWCRSGCAEPVPRPDRRPAGPCRRRSQAAGPNLRCRQGGDRRGAGGTRSGPGGRGTGGGVVRPDLCTTCRSMHAAAAIRRGHPAEGGRHRTGPNRDPQPSTGSLPGSLPRGGAARQSRVRLPARQPTVGEGEGRAARVVGSIPPGDSKSRRVGDERRDRPTRARAF